MTREQAKQFLTSLGIEEPTDEQVSNYLNSVSGEVNKEKEKAEQYKNDANKVKELQKQLDDINKQNMTDIELANKERDDAIKTVNELNAKVKRMEMKSGLAEKGIIGDDAEKLLDSLAGGSIDLEVLGQIISAKQEDAVNKKVAELSAGTIPPNGGGLDKDNQKTDADKMIENVASSLKGSNDISTIIDAYK